MIRTSVQILLNPFHRCLIIKLMSCQNSAYDDSEDQITLSKPLPRLKSASILSKARMLRSYRQSDIPDFGQKNASRGITVLIHDLLTNRQNKNQRFVHFYDLLQQLLQKRGEIHMFGDYRELLRYKYQQRHTYCIIINQKLREECETFIGNELSSGCNFTLHIICIFSTQAKMQEANKIAESKFKYNHNLHYYSSEDQNYPEKIVQLFSQMSISYDKTTERCSLSNFTSLKKEEQPQVHFICEEIIAKVLVAYRSKTKKDIKIDQFKTFDDVLLIVKEEKVSLLRELKESYYYTSMKDICSDVQTQSDKHSYIVHSDNSLNKSFNLRRLKSTAKDEEEHKLKVIICRHFHKDIKKIRAFVNYDKNKWNLWQIADEATGVINKLKEYFGQEQKFVDCLELQSYRSVTFSKEDSGEKEDSGQKEELFVIKKQEEICLPALITVNINNSENTIKSILDFGSKPLPVISLSFYPQFKAKQPIQQTKFIPVGFLHSTIDKKAPSLFASVPCLQFDPEPKTLAREILIQIKNNARKKMILPVFQQDRRPRFCSESGSNDDFQAFQPLPLPLPISKPVSLQSQKIHLKENEGSLQSSEKVIQQLKRSQLQQMLPQSEIEQQQQLLEFDQQSKPQENLTIQQQIIAKQPIKHKVFLQKHLYMKEFKLLSPSSQDSDFPFFDSLEVYYQSELGLAAKLQGEQGPCVVLYSEVNQKWIANLKSKTNSNLKWFCLEDENWIDEEGSLNYETNVVKLSSKIQLFGSLLSIRQVQMYQGLQFFQLILNESCRRSYQLINAKLHNNHLEQKSETELVQHFSLMPQKMMIVFVLALKESPELLCDLQQKSKGRMRLIYVQSDFVDSKQRLFVRYSEIHAVQKNLAKMQTSGGKNFVIFNTNCERSQLEALLAQKNLEAVEEKQYTSVWPDIQKIFSLIKGLYRRLHVVCYEDQQKDIQRIFSTYHIHNQQSQEILSFSLLKKDRSQNSSLKSIDHLSSNPISSERQSSLQFQATATLGNKTDEEGRGSLPIESRDHEEAPVKELERMVRVDDYSKILIVYQQMMNPEEKRGLLAACTKNEKIIPVLYRSVSQLKAMQLQSNLILLLMKQIPMQLFNELIQKEQLSIVFKNCNLKAVLPKYTDINLNQIIDLFEHSYTPSIRKLQNEQISQYLTKFEEQTSQKHTEANKEQSQLPSTSSTSNATKNEEDTPSRNQQGSPSSNLSQKTNLTSFFREVRAYEEQLSRLRKALNKNLLVLLVDFHKRNKYTIMAVKHHLIIQSYSGEANLETEIRKKIGRHVVLCIVENELLTKAITLKKKYSNAFFFLQHGKYSSDSNEEQRSYLAGQFGKSCEFQRFLVQTHKEEDKLVEPNPQSKLLPSSDLSVKMAKDSKRRNYQCTSMGSIQLKGEKSKMEGNEALQSRLSNNTLSKVKGSKIRSPHSKKLATYQHSQYYQK